MSYFDYTESRRIDAEGHPFYALIMAAMRQADTNNLAELKEAFPDTYDELTERYNAPGGFIVGEEELRAGMLTKTRCARTREEIYGDTNRDVSPGEDAGEASSQGLAQDTV